MPKKCVNYSKTIMYKIVCNDLSITDCYVGHTTDFIRRKQRHKSYCNEYSNFSHLRVYQSICANGGWNNWSMIEIEKYPCNDINEATARERYWFEILKANLNCVIPNRSWKERYEENKDHIAQKHKEWKEKNKEKRREYDLKNKEHIALKRKEWREKQKLKEKQELIKPQI